jgi:hypothetical protein
MLKLFKKIIIIISVMLVVFFIAFIIAAWYYGAFASVEKVTLSNRNRLYLVTTGGMCLSSEIKQQINTVDSIFNLKNISNKGGVALFYENPLKAKPDSLLARGAVLLEDSLAVDSPLVLITLPERKAAVTSIKAHPMVAPFKTYPAIQRWLYNNGYCFNPVFPVIEYYHSRGIIEVEMPVVADTSRIHLPLKEQ